MMPKIAVLICLALLPLVESASAQIVTPLEVVREANLPKDVYDIVAIGGLKAEIQCDAEQNLWIPGVRGYSSTISSLVRFGSKNATLHIDIDRNAKLKNGSIEYFSPLRDGGALALVRTVAEYNMIDGRPTRPKRYADTFAVTFGASGEISDISQLKIPLLEEEVTAVARLKNGWLTAGYTYDPATIEMHVHLFNEAGSRAREVTLPDGKSKASRTGSAEFAQVFRPTVLSAEHGQLLVFRGFTTQSLYTFSDAGDLLATTKLNPDGVDFWSPRLNGNSLFVQGDVQPEQIGIADGVPVHRLRSAFPIFDLTKGRITEVLTWMDSGTAACFDGSHVIVLQEVETGEGATWRILTLQRAVPQTPRPAT
jgi:hypothetical protein